MLTTQTLHSIQFTIIPKMATRSPFSYPPSLFNTTHSKPILSPLHHSCFLSSHPKKIKTPSFNFKSFSSLKDQNEDEKDIEGMGWIGRELKEFMDNPSLKASIKLEKMLNQKLIERDDKTRKKYPIFGVSMFRHILVKEKEMLQRAEETFIDLDLDKLKSCFGPDTFYVTDVARMNDQGMFIGNLRAPVDEVIPKLEKKLSDAAGREIVVWLTEEQEDGITKQVCMVQPKAEVDIQFEFTKLSNSVIPLRSIALAVLTCGIVALTGDFFLIPDDYLATVVPLSGGFLFILLVSEIATRVTAARYGVKLSQLFLVPSYWTSYLGRIKNYESILPNKKAVFDIPIVRTASAYLTSLVLAVAAFVADGSFNGGDNALYLRPQFFNDNTFFSLIQLFIGPYTDDVGNVSSNAVEGVGVPVDPLALAGLIGMVVTSLNLLPFEQLEGGQIAQAMFGRSTARVLSNGTLLLLGIGALNGNVLYLAWGLFVILFKIGKDLPAKDEITPLGESRYAWSFVLGFICFLTLFPNIGGTFSNSFPGDQYFRG